MELAVVLVSGLLAVFLLWWRSTKMKRPPGPWGLPVVGYLPFLTSKPYITFTKLAKRYGNVFSIRLGSLNMLILNDFQSTKEAFSQDAFIGRPHEIPFIRNKKTLESGAFFGLGWKEQRRHCLHLLRDLGVGRTKMEEHIQEEIDDLLEHFEKKVDKPFSMRPALAPSMSNNIGSLVFGKRMKFNDPMRLMLTRVISERAKEANQIGWLMFFPWLKKCLSILGIRSNQKLVESDAFLRNYIMKEINEHKETFNPDNIRDFIDGYLLEIQRRKNDSMFTEEMLQDLVSTFFVAGSDTVRQSVEWLVLIAASYQAAQQRIYEEIQNAMGQNRSPIWPDHKKMPYASAFMMEVMRWQTLVPINLQRCTLFDTMLNGYYIPKNTSVLSNHWAIHHDPEYWGADADEFRPERFLTEDGKEVKKFECFIPLSIGKRACPGEPLAKVEIFLYFISILQRFHVKMPEGKEADLEGVLGVALDPKAQAVILTKRM